MIDTLESIKQKHTLSYLSFYFIIFFILITSKAHSIQQISYKYNSPYSQKRMSENFFRFADKEHMVLKKNQKNYSLYFESISAFNTNHSNIDNFGPFYTKGKITTINSLGLSYKLNWLDINIEPYRVIHQGKLKVSELNGTFRYVNNHSNSTLMNSSKVGFKKSYITIHYKGIGFSYGLQNHWWGQGNHSSLVLSSNSPSQKSFSLGTFDSINYGKFSFSSIVLVMPYNNLSDNEIYFSGLNAKISYQSNPTISFGLRRTFLSGFNYLNDLENNYGPSDIKDWTIHDAFSLVVDPIFGQSKVGENYVISGTPGFDNWDQVISGFIDIYFHKEQLRLFCEIASDDNRANFTDLIAHWDHTLGYNIGLEKYTTIKNYSLLFGFEYLSTIVSNTFNPNFYRGDPDHSNFYYKSNYDYFTYGGRRMGAHSGTSSDDLFFIIGLGDRSKMLSFSKNIERHGLKSMYYPERKDEYSISFNYKNNRKRTFFINYEFEKIHNFAYEMNNLSKTNTLILGFNYTY